MMKKRISILTSFIVVIVLLVLAWSVSSMITRDNPREADIYQSFLEGKRLTLGIDPYARILAGDMRTNQKYPTYFPLFYEISYLSQELGLNDFASWIAFWQPAFMVFDCLIALLLYAVLLANKREWIGVVAASIWLYNRWTLFVITSSNFDFLPIFFMLAALVLYPKRKWLAIILFSLSLALKQIGIFIAPLFVVWAFTAEKKFWNGIKQAFYSAMMIGSIPLITSLPFLYWNLEGFVKSIAFSASRFGTTHIDLRANSLDILMNWEGIPARIPMAVMLLGIYWIAAKRPDRKYLAAFLTMTVFVGFNAVIFNQYLTWLLSTILLLLINLPGREDQVCFGSSFHKEN